MVEVLTAEQRRVLLDEVEEIFLTQELRILARFAGQSEEKRVDHLLHGRRTGRKQLELEEVRK
jgi:hypothetical protein